MNPGLWFCVPVHGRIKLASICLRQLRRTCESLNQAGIDATAVLIADKQNLRQLGRQLGRNMLGFQTVERENDYLSRKFNDGFQLALDERINPRPADFVVPCGSDDWVDHRIFLDLPDDNTIVGFQRMSFVREDGMEMMTSILNYPGGAGIRIYPRALLEPFSYRPADEDRVRACDTSILTNLLKHHGNRVRIEHRHHHDLQIIDWKSSDTQLNSYTDLARHRRAGVTDPFKALQGVYPTVSLLEMHDHYMKPWKLAA